MREQTDSSYRFTEYILSVFFFFPSLMVARGSSVILSVICVAPSPSCPYTLTNHFNISAPLSSVNNIHQSLALTTHNGQIIRHKSLIFLLWHCSDVHRSVFTVLRMIMNKKDLGNSKDSVPASQPFRVEWLHLISSDAIIAVKISSAAAGCKLAIFVLRRWREEAGVAGAGGAGGSHVTTKIRLTATVAAARRGALHLPGYTRLTKHHRYQTFLTQLQLQF